MHSDEGDDADDDDSPLPSTPRFAADLVDIELRDVELRHPPFREVSLANVNLRIGQGRVVAVVGAPSSGKATLLRLIANVLLPSRGVVFLPPHLTVIHVEQQPQLMQMTLAENLWLGRRAALDASAIERVCAVCAAVGLPETMQGSIRSVFETSSKRGAALLPDHDWRTALDLAKAREVDHLELDDVGHLPTTQATLVHLARSLIASPEVLVLHRPLALLDEAISKRVLGVLRTFVRERGLALDPAMRPSRRLRTVVFSCRSLEQALEVADDVVVAGLPHGGVTMFSADELNNDPELRATVVRRISHHDPDLRQSAVGEMSPASGVGADTDATSPMSPSSSYSPSPGVVKFAGGSPSLVQV